MPRAGSRRSVPSGDTRDRLVDAATTVLTSRGFGAATARAIADEAGCNSALVFYHHGSVQQLLLAALDASNERALSRYREAVAGADSVRDLLGVVRAQYAEDRASGHVALLAQLVAGGIVDRELGSAVAERVQPWIALAGDAVRSALPSAVRRSFPTDEVAYLIVAAALGAELLAALTGDHRRNDEVLEGLTRRRRLLRRLAAPA